MIFTQGLTYSYQQGTALVFDNVDLAQGEVLLLSGASGSGKSTWLALIAALLKPASGVLNVAGQSLTNLSAAAADAWRARNVGFMPQKLHLSAALTVQQNLAMAQWAANEAQDDTRILAALRSLGVDALAQRKPSQLSGGQAQRVALARAVLMQPRIVLADEPTASLDDQSAADAVELLYSTARQHQATLVIATHDARVPQLLSQQGASAFQRLQCRPLAPTVRT
jgi:putative ABC transport system ATP-binding protein